MLIEKEQKKIHKIHRKHLRQILFLNKVADLQLN